MLFLTKTDETIWKPPFLRKPPISEQFFNAPPLPKFQKRETPPPITLGGTKLHLSYPRM